MDMARVLGDCDRDEADLLRRAMGSKRGIERIESIKEKLMAGMAAKGIVGEEADAIYLKILSFANFGFAESHALSFAKLVYASSWCKLHYPGAFLAALLRSAADGLLLAAVVGPRRAPPRRRGAAAPTCRCPVRWPTSSSSASAAAHRARLLPASTASAPTGWPARPTRRPEHRRDTAYAVRLGLDSVRGISTAVAERIVAARAERPFADQVDLSRRAGLDARQLEALATAGVFDAVLSRRQALWNAGWTESEEHLEGIRVDRGRRRCCRRWTSSRPRWRTCGRPGSRRT